MRILVIEDEADLLASLAQALREEGYSVHTASDGAACSGLLDVHVSNLRRKLGGDWITTERGHGYHLE